MRTQTIFEKILRFWKSTEPEEQENCELCGLKMSLMYWNVPPLCGHCTDIEPRLGPIPYKFYLSLLPSQRQSIAKIMRKKVETEDLNSAEERWGIQLTPTFISKEQSKKTRRQR